MAKYASHSNISATPARFALASGKYAWSIVGTLGTGVTLQLVGPNGSTLVPVLAAVTASPTYVFNLSLPAGLYELTLSGNSTGVYSAITQVLPNPQA